MSRKYFYHWIPNWIITQLKPKQCSQCGIPYDKKNIVSFGIKSAKEMILFVEHKCMKCEHIERIGFSTEEEFTAEDMCYMLLDEYRNKRNIETAKRVRKNKREIAEISTSEMNDFIEFLQESSSHEDFMKHIGCEIKPDDIKNKIDTKKKRKTKKNKNHKDSDKKEK